MKKITLKKIWVYSMSRIRQLFSRRTLRYIDFPANVNFRITA